MSYVSFTIKLLLGCTLALLLALFAFDQVTFWRLFGPLVWLAILLYRAGGQIVARVKAENALARMRNKIMIDSLGLIHAFIPREQRELWERAIGNVHQVREKVWINREQSARPVRESYAQAMERLAQELRTEEAYAEILRVTKDTWDTLIWSWIEDLRAELPHTLTFAMPPETDQRPLTRELRQQLVSYQAELPRWLSEAQKRLAAGLRHCDDWEPVLHFVSDLRFRVLVAQDWAHTA